MKNNNKKIFIEALEQRIMLDGAGASTFLDIIDDRNKDKILQKNSKKITKFSENKVDDKSQTIPFDQVARDQKRNDRKQVVFIDSQVQDYQSLINAFNSDTEVYLIQSNEDGFKKIYNTLKDNSNISSLHIIGHGSAGKILFGNATLSNDTIQSYNQTLRSIGQYLTKDGDILFYGCNVASTEGGKALISKISEITKADIAASDDVTGKSGDWKLEIKVGHIDTKNINHTDYQHDLAMYRTASADTHAAEVTVGVDGITSIRGAMAAFTGTADRNAYDFKSSRDHNPNNSNLWQDYYMTYDSGTFGTGDKNDSDYVGRFTVVLEKTGITSGSITARRPANPFSNDKTESQWDSNSGYSYRRLINDTSFHHYELKETRSSPDADEGPMDVYLVALDAHFNANNDRYNKIAEVKFDREIIGILKNDNQTMKLSSNTGNIAMHNPNNNTYPTSNSNSNRSFETIYWKVFKNDYTDTNDWDYGTFNSGDWIAVGGTDNRILHVGAKNTGGGDYVRVLVKGEVASNNAPVAQNDVGVVNEDATLTVANSSNANESGGSYDANGEYSGDIMDTSSSDHSDSDADSDAITVTHIQHSSAGSATAVGAYTYSHGSATSVTGTYGTLTIGSDGSYEYVADQSAADDLDSGDSVTDVFTYTISDGTATDTATLTITVLGINDAPVAQNDEGVIKEGQTLTVTNSANANVSGSYDATGEHSGDVIDTSSSSHSDSDADDSASLSITAIQPSGGSSSNVSAGSSYNSSGTSVSGTYGTLTIGADGSYTYVAGSVSGNVTDVFTYTVSDGNGGTDTATLTITILNNTAPVAAANTGTVNEDDTITVTNGESSQSQVYEVNNTLDSSTTVSSDSSESSGSGISFSRDGKKMFITGIEDNKIHEWTLSTAFDPTSKSYVDSVLLDWNNNDDSGDVDYSDDQGDWVRGHAWKSDGTKLFVMNWDGGLSGDATATYRICSYDLTTPYDISTISKTNSYVDAPTSSNSYDTGLTQSVRSFAMSNDGTKFFFINKATEYIHQITFATAYDLSSNASSATYDASAAGTPRSIAFSANGKKLFIGEDTNDRVYQYNLSTAFDISSTVSLDGYVDLVTSADPLGIAFDHSGTKMFIHDIDGNDTIDVHSLKSPFNLIDIDDEHDGDVLLDDSDADGDTLTVTQIAVTGSSNSAVSNGSSYNSSGTSKTGTYGTLTIGADGSYTYVADQSAADALDPGDIVTDSFTYTVSDGTDTDTETLIITVIGINDAPVGVNDTDAVNEDATVTRSSGSSLLIADDTDVDGDDSSSTFVVTQIQPSGGSASAVTFGSSYNSSGTSVTGTYGTLTLGADGTYTYIADQSAADDLDDGDTVNDVFTYTVSDRTTTDTATLTITVTGVNDAPVAQNDEGVIVEDGTLTVNNSDNANVSGSYDATGEHSGDVLHTSSGSHTDSDVDDDDTASLVVSSIRTGSSEGNGTAGTVGQALTGTYGELTLNANGSYTYVANQSAADELDSGDSATDVFNYTVSDGNGGTDIATITITILGANDTPVAVDDTDSVNVDETTTATDGSANDVLTDDTDADDSASLTVTAIQPSGGSSSNVSAGSSYNSSGTEVTGTYGTLTIGADGSYTYVADQDAADNISAGSSVTDVFTYTVSDGTSTDTATLTITISAPESESNNSEIKKDKKEAKKQKKEEKKARKKEKREKRLLKKSFKLSKDLSERKAQFNQGLKLVDLVAETKSIEIKEKDSFVDKIKTKQSTEGLSVKFKVFNDEGKEVQKYYGIMKDGSPLPDWIKVDPKTGRTKTNIPKDVNILEFKIIAVDVDNNRKEVTVVIDPEKIAKDKEIIKEARKISIPKKIEVQNNGSVKLNSVNEDGTINKTTTSSINNIESFEDLINTTKPDEFLKLESKLRGNAFVVELPNEIKNNFENFKIVLKDGKKLPEWIKFNLDNGEIIANPPKNIETIDLKIIVEDSNGEITVKDLKVDFSSKNTINSELIINNDTKFVSLSNQLSKEYTNWNDYGSQIIDSL